ncbi:uncharacterized protein LOC129059141 [Pongo abelii]|uniref:uncharacterized protein LOC129059141 n=1 Tax=Pongo abelii TaxID=9601 RepID=UPI0023E780E9|nr:uncharacterized protein LOC129059141 [Pongo abelii]
MSGRKVSAFDTGTASPSSSSLNIFSCAPLGITHLNSSSTPSGASLPAGSTGIQGLGIWAELRFGWRSKNSWTLARCLHSPLQGAAGSPGNLVERRLQMSAESSQEVVAPRRPFLARSSECDPLRSERSAHQSRPFPR